MLASLIGRRGLGRRPLETNSNARALRARSGGAAKRLADSGLAGPGTRSAGRESTLPVRMAGGAELLAGPRGGCGGRASSPRARHTPVTELDPPDLAPARPLDPGEQGIGPHALVSDSLGKIVVRVLEYDGGVAQESRGEYARRLARGMRFVGESLALLPEDHQLVFHQAVGPHRSA